MPIVASPADTPDLLRTEIEFADHAEGTDAIGELFGVGPELLRDGEGWAVETFTRFGTHNSTHIDAPYHYNSTIRGEPARRSTSFRSPWFFAPGVVLDFRDRDDGDAIDVVDIEAAVETTEHSLRELDIVLIHTGRDAYIDEPDYMARGTGIHPEATRWLYEHGVRVMGIDAWGWDKTALDAGSGSTGERKAGCLLGLPSGQPCLLPNRAPSEPRPASSEGLHRRVLPLAPGRRQRCARACGRGHRLAPAAQPVFDSRRARVRRP